MKTRALALVIGLIGSTFSAMADSPWPPPERSVTCSTSGSVCADSDPKSNRTVVLRKGKTEALWAVPGWHRWLFPSNDGAALVVGFDGMNLIPKDSTLQLDVLHFYNRGKLVRVIRLADLYTDRSQLKPTVSHLAWVNEISANSEDQLVVELMSRRKVVFSMATGQLLR